MTRDSPTLWSFAGEAMQAMFSGCPGFTSEAGDYGWYVATGEPIADFNCAYVAPGKTEQSTFNRLSRQFSKLRCPYLICGERQAKARLGLTSHKLGLLSIGELPLMAIDPGRRLGTPNPDVQVVRVANEDQLRTVVELGSRTYRFPEELLVKVVNMGVINHPRLTMLLAALNGVPAGFVTFSTHDSGKSVGVWSMATAPEARRQGVATTLVHSILASSPIAQTCFLLATEQGKPVYEKVGFEIVEFAHVWCGGTK